LLISFKFHAFSTSPPHHLSPNSGESTSHPDESLYSSVTSSRRSSIASILSTRAGGRGDPEQPTITAAGGGAELEEAEAEEEEEEAGSGETERSQLLGVTQRIPIMQYDEGGGSGRRGGGERMNYNQQQQQALLGGGGFLQGSQMNTPRPSQSAGGGRPRMGRRFTLNPLIFAKASPINI
jgi:hypothetical protein